MSDEIVTVVESDFQQRTKQRKTKMKLLDVMKKYDRCVMRESAKLTKIYNLLLKESAEADDIEEAEVCPDCGNDPCTCECGESEDVKTDEAEEMISAEEFFGEAEKAAEDCDETEDVEENDMLRNRPHNAHIDDPAGIKESDETEDATDEAEEMMSAEEFFSESDDSKENTDESDETEDATDESDDSNKSDETEGATDEAEEMMSAEEFFSEGDDDKSEENNESDEKSDDKKVTESDESEEKKDEVDESECDEDDEEKEEKKLEESLKSYRRANH